ncbi:Peptidase family A1 domain [Arabidopsis thaliana x Arabidopsis arenosa]|uniref:Peptidase family A1 domain n=1 Tax=Arabidopsis thaliana x Arabidopsis arenosa TaxID=1240361 RepID=A0A8T1ZPG5_9BRAS|nr:Peptidase family A1 domain [Arabidopsis thaliana x Arabidopsis arenosa]
MASSSSSPPLFYFFLIFLSVVSAVKLPLSPFSHSDQSPKDPYLSLRRLAESSIARAHKLKHGTSIKPDEDALSSTTTASATVVKSPLSPKSYGGYSVSLSFGTPSQTIPFVFDTGSSLVWFPCTSRYLCSDCNFSGLDPTQIPRFIPKNSSSSRVIGCQNPKCQFLFGANVQCRGCDPNTRNCTVPCPPYILQYGLGSTAGILLSEKLDFPDLTVPDFVVGCSIISTRQPAGIAGFGRGPESLPSQMKLKRFSHCLVSRRFDDTNVTTDLDLDTGSGHKSGSKTPGLIYTPFRKNPNVSNTAFLEYYYLNLRRIYVGSKHVKIPYKFLAPGTNGNGGSIVDSGSTFTFMERPVFELVAEEFATQMSNYTREKDLEKVSGLAPCFNISGKGDVTVPELIFEFKGGAKMELPLSNYFSFVGNADTVCLTVVSDNTVNPGGGTGPAIILGSFQQQNYLVEYDLENDRFGFAKKKCSP